MPLFAEADDSETEIANYKDLGDILVARLDGAIVGHAQSWTAMSPVPSS